MGNQAQHSLAERLQQRALQQAPIRGRASRAAFRALRPQIEEALAAGHRMVAIWELLHEEGKFSATYSTFRRYCAEAKITPGMVRKPEAPPQFMGAPKRQFSHDPSPDAGRLY